MASVGIELGFARHGIRLPALPVSRRSQARSSPYRALRALDPDRPGGGAALRAALHVSPGARIERTSLPARVGGGVREQYIHRDSIQVRDRSLGRLSGVTVRIHCGCTLTRGPSGDVEGASLAPHPHPSPAEVTRQLKRWMAMDAIEIPGRGAPAKQPRPFPGSKAVPRDSLPTHRARLLLLSGRRTPRRRAHPSAHRFSGLQLQDFDVGAIAQAIAERGRRASERGEGRVVQAPT